MIMPTESKRPGKTSFSACSSTKRIAAGNRSAIFSRSCSYTKGGKMIFSGSRLGVTGA